PAITSGSVFDAGEIGARIPNCTNTLIASQPPIPRTFSWFRFAFARGVKLLTFVSGVTPSASTIIPYPPEMCAVRWYLRCSLSYRDGEELLTERGLSADHTTIWRWVQRYAPELNKRCRRELKPTKGSWRVDETYIRVAGEWRYLYRAVDSTGATIDFWVSV